MVHRLTRREQVGNKLLDALPDEEYEHILPDLERTSFSFDECIYES